MNKLTLWMFKQAHIVWLASIINIGLGIVIPEFDFMSKSISHVALESPFFAYTHRLADIIIGLSMCTFAFGIHSYLKRFSSASLSSLLLGISMISAGIWTLETPLHLVYNLSIFMIIVPMSFALEFKNIIKSRTFENFSVSVTVLHVVMFWLIYAGFIPQEFNGLIQRLWAIPTMGWFGIAAHLIVQRYILANKALKADS